MKEAPSCLFVCLSVLSCFVLFCLVLSCFVLFCLVLSCFVLFCLVLSCFVLFCLVLSCFVLFCLVLSCFVLFCLVLSCFVLFCFVLFVCLFGQKLFGCRELCSFSFWGGFLVESSEGVTDHLVKEMHAKSGGSTFRYFEENMCFKV